LVLNIADNVRLRFQNHFSALNGTFDGPIDDHPLGRDRSDNVSTAGNHKRSSVQFTFDAAVDLNQAVGRDTPHYL
jgi:hypothetical protein